MTNDNIRDLINHLIDHRDYAHITHQVIWDSEEAREAFERIQREILSCRVADITQYVRQQTIDALQSIASRLYLAHTRPVMHITIAPGAPHQPTTNGTHTPGQ